MNESVWGGVNESISLSSKDDIYLTQSPRDFDRIIIVTTLDDYIQAPVVKGEKVGNIIFELDGIKLHETDLVASSSVASKGFFGKIWSNLQLLVYGFMMEDENKKEL